ncbi:MAG: hypothetical protein JWQ27_760 [Ferruginibacter sp.]|nr:hypothetical protein [Ferruginibacter sp.]
MPYSSGTRLPGEMASKLGHISVIESPWVQSLVEDFESSEFSSEEEVTEIWQEFDAVNILPLKNIWAVDGSFVAVKTSGKPPKEVSFVKTALLTVDRLKLDKIDKEHPHPLLMQDILRDSAIFHATVFPLKNVKTSLGSNYDAIRNIVNDSLKVDDNGVFYETLKWLAYRKWDTTEFSSPGFECPHCHFKNDKGLPFDADGANCEDCDKPIYLTDMIGFHLDMDEDSAPDSVASAYMLVMEHLMLFTPIRLLWSHSDQNIISETLFIKDGPLTLRSQYSKLIPNIRSFIQHAKNIKRPVHIIGQEKSGAFFDHLASIVQTVAPHDRGEKLSFAPLTHDYVRRQVYRSPDLSNPYGKRTNWGEKLFVKIDPGTYMVLNVPTGIYVDDGSFPLATDLIGVERILATLPEIVSSKFEGALFPVELANGVASMSSYPSAKILERFLDGR